MDIFREHEDNFIQILQREIARTRVMNVEQQISPFRLGHHDDRQDNGGDQNRAERQVATGTGGKRKYRRHPKVLTSVPWRENVCALSRFSRCPANL